MATAGKDYKAIAAKKIHKPGQKPHRFLVYGRNKQGKTTFCATAPNVLIVDPEDGAERLEKDSADIWPVTTWADLQDVFKYLQGGSHTYEWVAIDGLSKIANMSLRFVMDQYEERDLDRIPGMVQQRDYGKSGELMKGLLYNLHALPVGLIYTAQDRMETPGAFDQEDDDAEEASARFVPDLPRGVRSTVNALVDVIGRIYSVKVEGVTKAGKEVSGMQRRLWIGPTETYDTGYRSPHKLPPYIKGPTVEKLINSLNEGAK